MKKYILVGFILVTLIISFPSSQTVSASWACDTDEQCASYCLTACSLDRSCNPKYSCGNNDQCRCDCSGCGTADIITTCNSGPWYDCSATYGAGCQCRELYEVVYGTPNQCLPQGNFEVNCDGATGGDSSCGNAAPPGCSGVCGSGTHCGSSGNSSCSCKPNHTCAEFLQPLHWPRIFRTSETTAIVSWDPYSAPERGADTLTIQIYPENINP